MKITPHSSKKHKILAKSGKITSNFETKKEEIHCTEWNMAEISHSKLK